ncbi:hypothetical protein RRF57_012761 [Xylaria bambusicola]|uniref:Uncharacterized protein n=1 Tax=Xylaria bambusicola TaxID=326684 RepID=A0AAN7V4J4_9PEZI
MQVGSIQTRRVGALKGEPPNCLEHEPTEFEECVLRAGRLQALNDPWHPRVMVAEFEKAYVGEIADAGVFGNLPGLVSL